MYLSFKEILVTLHNIWSEEKNESRSLFLATVVAKPAPGDVHVPKNASRGGLVLSGQSSLLRSKISLELVRGGIRPWICW